MNKMNNPNFSIELLCSGMVKDRYRITKLNDGPWPPDATLINWCSGDGRKNGIVKNKETKDYIQTALIHIYTDSVWNARAQGVILDADIEDGDF